MEKNVRVCKATGKVYTYDNIPVVKGKLTSVQNSKGFFKIFAENNKRPDDSWYNGRFIGDRWAVFQWVNTTPEQGYYHQVSPWYEKFGNAFNKLLEVSNSDSQFIPIGSRTCSNCKNLPSSLNEKRFVSQCNICKKYEKLQGKKYVCWQSK